MITIKTVRLTIIQNIHLRADTKGEALFVGFVRFVFEI